MHADRDSLGGPQRGVNAGTGRTFVAAFGNLIGRLADRGAAGDLLPETAAMAVERLGCAAAVVLGRRPDGEGWQVRGLAGLDDTEPRGGALATARACGDWVAQARGTLRVPDAATDARFPAGPEGPALAIPLIVEGSVEGVFVLFGPPAPPDGAADPLELLGAAAGAALHADRMREVLRETSRRLDASEAERLRAERATVLADVLRDMTVELKQGLAGLGSAALKLGRSLDSQDPRQATVEVLLAEVRRMSELVQQQVGYAGVQPSWGMEDPNRILAECLALVSDAVRERDITVYKRFGSSIPLLVLDLGLMRQVLLNLLRGVLAHCPRGGRFKAETRRKGSRVELLIAADTQAGTDVFDTLWGAFAGEGGSEASHRVMQKILHLHRGSIRVSQDPQWGLVVSLVLPIPVNADRRTHPERRAGEDRRRA